MNDELPSETEPTFFFSFSYCALRLQASQLGSPGAERTHPWVSSHLSSFRKVLGPPTLSFCFFARST